MDGRPPHLHGWTPGLEPRIDLVAMIVSIAEAEHLLARCFIRAHRVHAICFLVIAVLNGINIWLNWR